MTSPTTKHLLLPTDRLQPKGFTLLEHNIRLSGYQLYAVEKWLVDRSRQVTLLVVYTGDAAHEIEVDVWGTSREEEWDGVVGMMRADGAKPKTVQVQTPNPKLRGGVLMLTSLGAFRSDYTIVRIPQGTFTRALQDRVFANIGLLRMGCTRRMGLTLEEPSGNTKERFARVFCLGCERAGVGFGFGTAVLELVKLVQGALVVFGVYKESVDGLLCDETVRGVKVWIESVGGPCLGLEQPDTPYPIDPPLIAGLLSLVLSTRNKLAALGYAGVLPRDPFLYPYAFGVGLGMYVQACTGSQAHLQTPPSTSANSPASASASVTNSPSLTGAWANQHQTLPLPQMLYHTHAFAPHPSNLAGGRSQSSQDLTLNSSRLGQPLASASGSAQTLIPHVPSTMSANVYALKAALDASAAVNGGGSGGGAGSATSLALPPGGGGEGGTGSGMMFVPLTRDLVEGIDRAWDDKVRAKDKVSKRESKISKKERERVAGVGGKESDTGVGGGLGGERDRDNLKGKDRERRNTLSEGEGLGQTHSHKGITASGTQILSGIGTSLANVTRTAGGLGTLSHGHGHGHGHRGVHMHAFGHGKAQGHGHAVELGALVVPTTDLEGLVGGCGAEGGEGKKEKKRKGQGKREKEKERTKSVDVGALGGTGAMGMGMGGGRGGYASYAYAQGQGQGQSRKVKDAERERVGGTDGESELERELGNDREKEKEREVEYSKGKYKSKDDKDREKERATSSLALETPALRDGLVGGSVQALWSGRVGDVVRMRERMRGVLEGGESVEFGTGGLGTGTGVSSGMGMGTGTRLAGVLGRRDKEKDKDKERKRHTLDVSPFGQGSSRVISDGDGEDGRSTDVDGGQVFGQDDVNWQEEESDVIGSGGSVRGHGHEGGGGGGHASGFRWGGRVGGKLGSWAGLTKRKHQHQHQHAGRGRGQSQSVDLSATSSIGSSLRGGLGHGVSSSVSVGGGGGVVGGRPDASVGRASKDYRHLNPNGDSNTLSNIKDNSKDKDNHGTAHLPGTLPKLIIGGLASAGNSTLNFASGGGGLSAGGSNMGSLYGSVRRPTGSRRSTVSGSGAFGFGGGAGASAGGGGGGGSERAQSPTLPSLVPLGYPAEPDDDDLLSSGQVSPLSDYRPNPFSSLHSDRDRGERGAGGSGPGPSTKFDEQTLSKLLLDPTRKRPWAVRRLSQTARITSWADPVSARVQDWGDLDGDDEGVGLGEDVGVGVGSKYAGGRAQVQVQQRRPTRPGTGTGWVYGDEEESDASLYPPLPGNSKKREKTRFHSLLSVVDGEGQTVEKAMEESEYSDEDDEEDDEGGSEDWEWDTRRKRCVDLKRRRSFHDLDSFRDLEVLSPERMKIDVELCGQCLIMYRREEHLRNVVTCVQLLSASLAQTSTSLREHYKSHLSELDALPLRTQIISSIDEETSRTDRLAQGTNTLRYESEQFNVGDLWAAASPPRHKVFELREKVFGMGGRRLKKGVKGAHGGFNRAQWGLDDEMRLVDYLGRTEDEREEERKVERGAVRLGVVGVGVGGMVEEGEETEEEEDVVEHPSIKPMWLLRFFTSWGARWGAKAPVSKEPEEAGNLNDKSPVSEVGSPLDATVAPSAMSSPQLGSSGAPVPEGRRRPYSSIDTLPGSFS